MINKNLLIFVLISAVEPLAAMSVARTALGRAVSPKRALSMEAASRNFSRIKIRNSSTSNQVAHVEKETAQKAIPDWWSSFAVAKETAQKAIPDWWSSFVVASVLAAGAANASVIKDDWGNSEAHHAWLEKHGHSSLSLSSQEKIKKIFAAQGYPSVTIVNMDWDHTGMAVSMYKGHVTLYVGKNLIKALDQGKILSTLGEFVWAKTPSLMPLMQRVGGAVFTEQDAHEILRHEINHLKHADQVSRSVIKAAVYAGKVFAAIALMRMRMRTVPFFGVLTAIDVAQNMLYQAQEKRADLAGQTPERARILAETFKKYLQYFGEDDVEEILKNIGYSQKDINHIMPVIYKLFATHPHVLERIAYLEEFAAQKQANGESK